MAVPEELLAFVKDAMSRGVPQARIEAALLGAGWERKQVEAGLAGYGETDFSVPVPRPRPYLSAREAFFSLLLFTTLYLSAFQLGSLLFQFIYLAVPDAAAPPYQGNAASVRSSIRWAVSTLIIAFPLFLYLSARTAREIQRDPAMRASKVRRWLTYLTLFIAATIIIGDLIVLINDLLGGEVTLRFLLKSLVVGAISGTLFVYYLRDLRQDEAEAAA